MIRTSALLLILWLFTSFTMEESRYHKVPALPGDGVYSLLRRYKLDQYSCNHAQFYDLNHLSENAGLKVGRYYYVPIVLYEFNGKTIRSSIGVDDWDLAKKIETYNDDMLRDGYRPQSFREDRSLWVPYHFLHCPSPDLPAGDPEKAPENQTGEIEAIEASTASTGTNLAVATGGSRRFPIFGKDYEYVPLESTKLTGRVYYIVTGHGGPDPGAMGKKGGNTLCEDEYAYDVGLRLARNLLAHGATAYMIVRDPDDGIRPGQYLDCDYDEVIWGNKSIFQQQKARLNQRADAINELYEKHRKQGVTSQQAIIIHVDSRSRSTQTDLFFYYHPSSNESKALAQTLHGTMSDKYKQHRASGAYHGTVTPRDLHMLRETKPTSVYIELGNIRNSFDQQRIVIESNRQALANWLFEGLKGK